MLRNFILPVIAFVFALFGSAGATNDTVRVEGGLISVSVVDEVRIYKGIPFAAPPMGELRWKAPQSVAAWEGVRKCDDFGPDCPQAPYPQSSLYYSAPHKQSEDCLYLNVWTAAKASEKPPIIAWIHGGALARGSGATRAYDGTALAKKGGVLAPINYRLGPPGYLAVKSEDDIAAAFLSSLRDSSFTLPMRTWARMTTTGRSKAYLYFFSHVPPNPNSKYLGYLVNFATTGDPNGRGLPKWTPYNFEAEDYLDFGGTVQLRNHLLKAQLDFIEQFQKRR